MLNEIAVIGSTGGHDDFDLSFFKVVVMPVGTEFDDAVVEVGSDPAA